MNKRIFFLDYLRVYAFLSVLIGHKYYVFLSPLESDPSIAIWVQEVIKFINRFFVAGGAGVVIFFLISGYIIIKVAIEESPKEFLINRIFRIYPLYMFAVIFEVILSYIFAGEEVEFSSVIPSLLLCGDIFNTPYALGGVEWTLRLEILFYLTIYFLKIVKILGKPKLILVSFYSISIIIQLIRPIPVGYGWTDGYATIFFPFLLFGSTIYLFEREYISSLAAWLFGIFLIITYFIEVPRINNEVVASTHFSMYALILFLVAWKFREYFKYSRLVLYFSNLTYSIYLFHNWLWDWIDEFLNYYVQTFSLRVALIPLILILICSIFTIFIEKPSIKIGKALSRKLAR